MVVGDIWILYRGEELVARLTVTGWDFPFVHAEIEETVAFGGDRALFTEQEQAFDAEDYDRVDDLWLCIGERFALTDPVGDQVPDFFLRIHGDGTAGWR